VIHDLQLFVVLYIVSISSSDVAWLSAIMHGEALRNLLPMQLVYERPIIPRLECHEA
jgi:hypothetical protein